MLHATLKDLLRDLGLERIPLADQEILSRVPFAGGEGRKTNFTLGDLTGYRNRSVDDFIAESVKVYLDRRSYNNIDDVAAALREIGVKTSEIKTFIDAFEVCASKL